MTTATKNLIRGRRTMNKERDVDFQEERSLTRLPSLSFKQDREMESLCSATFQPHHLSRLRRSLMEEFKYLTLFDEIPASTSLGRIKPREDGFVQYFLFTHLNSEVFYRDDRVVRVRASSERTVDITETMYGEHWEHWEHGTWSDLPLHVNFTFSLKWKSAGNRIHSYNMHRDSHST